MVSYVQSSPIQQLIYLNEESTNPACKLSPQEILELAQTAVKQQEQKHDDKKIKLAARCCIGAYFKKKEYDSLMLKAYELYDEISGRLNDKISPSLGEKIRHLHQSAATVFGQNNEEKKSLLN